MGSAIAAGTDGAQMALAMEAIERASLRGDLARLTKTIALIEFFRNRSGVVASPKCCSSACQRIRKLGSLTRSKT